MRVLLTKPPYQTALTMPPPADRIVRPRAFWTPSGAAVLRDGLPVAARGFVVEADEKTIQPLPFPFDTATNNVAQAVGLVTPGGGVYELHAWNRKANKERLLLTNRTPAPLDAALVAARIAPAKTAPNRLWQFFTPTLTSNGNTVYFAAHDGTTASVRLFACEIATGQLRLVLPDVGDGSGRQSNFVLSPDNKRLLWERETGGARYSGQVAVADLQTGRLLTIPGTAAKNRRTVTAGACWSPDGRYLAVAVGYFGSASVPARYDILVCETVTGKPIRTIPNAFGPSWGP